MVDGDKNPAYGRHQLSWPMRIVAPILWNPFFYTLFGNWTHIVALFVCIFCIKNLDKKNMCLVSRVICHKSHVMCHMSRVTCHPNKLKNRKNPWNGNKNSNCLIAGQISYMPLDQNFFWPPEVGVLQWRRQTDRQIKKRDNMATLWPSWWKSRPGEV